MLYHGYGEEMGTERLHSIGPVDLANESNI